MRQPKWSTEHSKLLQDLRQKAGLDMATLARRHMVSTTQVKQLEEGGDSAFYSDGIKFLTGKKLLLALGHALMVPVDEAPQPLAPPVEEVFTPKSKASRNWTLPVLIGLIALTCVWLYVNDTGSKASPAEIKASASTR